MLINKRNCCCIFTQLHSTDYSRLGQKAKTIYASIFEGSHITSTKLHDF